MHLNTDGTYTYTPGTDFDGVDSFRVVAADVGPHVNLLDPFRQIGTSADNLINQRAVRFTFANRTGSDAWTPERRAALNNAADRLVEYLTVTRAVTVTYDVLGEDDPNSRTLAWASSEPISGEPGYWRTVVQNKIISGIDSNGAGSDGQIAYDFGHNWGLGDTLAGDEFEFTSVAMHEVLHSFGFMTLVGRPGTNTDRDWLIYDQFVMTADGRRPIDSDLTWDEQYDPKLTGQGGGFYFGGSNAVEARGVPGVYGLSAAVQEHHLWLVVAPLDGADRSGVDPRDREEFRRRRSVRRSREVGANSSRVSSSASVTTRPLSTKLR